MALKVGNNYGFQGDNRAQKVLQPSNTEKIIQPSAPIKYVQPTAPAKKIQSAGNASAIQAAAKAQQLAVAAEVARQQQRKLEVQNSVTAKTNANTTALKLRVASPQSLSTIRPGANFAPAKIQAPKNPGEDDEYTRVKNEARDQAMRLVDSTKQDPSSGFWDKAVDKATFGSDRRASAARSYAQEQAQYLADRQIKVYEQKLDAYTKLQASLQKDYENKRASLNPTQLNALADQYNLRLATSLKDLNHVAAWTEGMLEGYGVKSEEKITSKPAATAGWINRNVVQKAAQNPIWKYTLGEGSRNMPSLVTAPSRLVNLVGNLNTKDRDIYKYGGETANRIQSKDNAWQTTFNQRNFNIRPVTDKAYNRDVVWSELKKKQINDSLSTGYSRRFKDAKTDEERDKVAKEYWDSKNRSARNMNSAQEIVADPLALLEFIKAPALLSKADDVGRSSKATAWAFKGADKIKEATSWAKLKAMENPFVKTLGKEAKSRQEVYTDAIKSRSEARMAHFNKWDSSYKQMIADTMGKPVSDLKVLDDIAQWTDEEFAIASRVVEGQVNWKDATKMLQTYSKPSRAFFQDTVRRYKELMDEVAQADRITEKSSRFLGKGSQLYLPKAPILYDDVPQEGWFRKFKKNNKAPSAQYANESIRQRLFDSDYDELMGAKYSRAEKAEKSLSQMQKEKLDLEQLHDYEIRQARNRTKTFVGRAEATWNKINPIKLWKKSVLKYRPAWTVNNVLYNTQAGFLSGGMGYLPEQIKMLNPRYARKAAKELPEELLQDIAKQYSGTSKLDKFYNKVENNPRIATFKALKKKNFSDEEALKRVNKYFFNQKTKNWEKPIESVIPFWQWQKNLTKAAVNMPFDRPMASIGYNRLGQHQKLDFERQFEDVAKQMKNQGYTDEEIEKEKDKQAGIFATRLRVGDKYYSTPFNAFSDRGLSSVGFNPYLAAAGEFAEGVDSYGRKVKGNEASLKRRLSSKFPQVELGIKQYKSYRVDKGLDKPSEKYIGKEGSEGYGLTKEKQGYDKSKPNYVPSMDPRNKSDQDMEAFLGKPRELTFDKNKLIEGKKLQKVTADYFSKDWKSMDFPTSEKERKALFDKYGITADEFYKGILSKYDSDFTKSVKAKKEEAAAKNKALFEEYQRQPKGTRNQWAVKKLKQLNDAGYFGDNPFLKSFDWINSDSVGKARKQDIVQRAVKTGDWSEYRKVYGYKKSGKHSPHQYSGKYFKTADSMEKYKEGEFWGRYAKATKVDRKKLLADNPQYNRRANWTDDQWDNWKKQKRAADIENLAKTGGSRYQSHLAKNKADAQKYQIRARVYRRSTKKVAYA